MSEDPFCDENLDDHDDIEQEVKILEANSSLVSDIRLIEKSYDTTVIEEQPSVRHFQNVMFEPKEGESNNSKLLNSNNAEQLKHENEGILSKPESRAPEATSEKKGMIKTIIKKFEQGYTSDIRREEELRKIQLAELERLKAIVPSMIERYESEIQEREAIKQQQLEQYASLHSQGKKSKEQTGASATEDSGDNGLLEESEQQEREEAMSIREKKIVNNPFPMLSKQQRNESHEEFKDIRETANFEPLAEKKSLLNQHIENPGAHFNPFQLSGPADFDLTRPSGNFGTQFSHLPNAQLNEIIETESEQGDSSIEKIPSQRNQHGHEKTSEIAGTDGNNKNLKFDLPKAENYSMNASRNGPKMIELEGVLEDDTENTKDYTQLEVPLFKNMFYKPGTDNSIVLNFSKLKDETGFLALGDLKSTDRKESSAAGTDRIKLSEGESDKSKHRAKFSRLGAKLAEGARLGGGGKDEEHDIFQRIATMLKEEIVFDELNDSKRSILRDYEDLKLHCPGNRKLQNKNGLHMGRAMALEKNKGHPNPDGVDFLNMKLDISAIQLTTENNFLELEGDQSFISRNGEALSKRSRPRGSLIKGKDPDNLLSARLETPVAIIQEEEEVDSPYINKRRVEKSMQQAQKIAQNGELQVRQEGTRGERTEDKASPQQSKQLINLQSIDNDIPKQLNGFDENHKNELHEEIFDPSKLQNALREKLQALEENLAKRREALKNFSNRMDTTKKKAAIIEVINNSLINASYQEKSFSKAEAQKIVDEFLSEVIRKEGLKPPPHRDQTSEMDKKSSYPSKSTHQRSKSTMDTRKKEKLLSTTSNGQDAIISNHVYIEDQRRAPSIDRDITRSVGELPTNQARTLTFSERKTADGMVEERSGSIGLKDVIEPPHNRPTFGSGLLIIPGKSDPSEVNPLFAMTTPIKSIFTTPQRQQRGSLNDRSSKSPTPAQDAGSASQVKNFKLSPRDLYRTIHPPEIHSNFNGADNGSMTNEKKSVVIADTRIPKPKQRVLSSPSPKQKQIGLSFRINNSAGQQEERKIGPDIFCMNCEEFVALDRVDSHSTQCFKKTDRHNKPSPSMIDLEIAQRFNHATIEECNQKIEKIVMKFTEFCQIDEQKSLMRPEFYEICKRLLIEAADIISENANCEAVWKKMQEFDKRFDLLSKMAKKEEVGVLFYFQRMFVAIQNKIDSLEAHQRENTSIAQLEEQLKAYELEATKKKAELELWQCQSEMLQTIQRNDAKNIKYIRNEVKKNLEVLSQIHSDVSSSFGQSDESSRTTEGETASLSKLSPARSLQFDRESKRRYFYTEAVNIKLTLPPNHPGRDYLISELYEECIASNIPRDGYVSFIKEKYGIR